MRDPGDGLIRRASHQGNVQTLAATGATSPSPGEAIWFRCVLQAKPDGRPRPRVCFVAGSWRPTGPTDHKPCPGIPRRSRPVTGQSSFPGTPNAGAVVGIQTRFGPRACLLKLSARC